MNTFVKPTHSLYFSIGANIALIFSIGLNVALIASWVYPSSQRAEPVATTFSEEPAAPQQIHPDLVRAGVAPAAVATSAHLDWQKLESDDYPTYIANLRSAGIPEPALRSIITSEIAEEYEGKRQKVIAQRAATESTRLQKQQLLEQLSQEQSAVVVDLLNSTSSEVKPTAVPRTAPISAVLASANPVQQMSREQTPVAVGFSNSSSPGAHGKSATGLIQNATSTKQNQTPKIQADRQVASKAVEVQRTASLPAVLAPAHPAIQLTELQAAEWGSLQQNFVQAVGDSSQDPTDPNYLAKWNEEQRQSDDQFRAMYGSRAYVLQSLQAGHVGK